MFHDMPIAGRLRYGMQGGNPMAKNQFTKIFSSIGSLLPLRHTRLDCISLRLNAQLLESIIDVPKMKINITEFAQLFPGEN